MLYGRFEIAACATDELQMLLGVDHQTENQDIDGSALVLQLNLNSGVQN
jgi:hypothetical protein